MRILQPQGELSAAPFLHAGGLNIVSEVAQRPFNPLFQNKKDLGWAWESECRWTLAYWICAGISKPRWQCPFISWKEGQRHSLLEMTQYLYPETWASMVETTGKFCFAGGKWLKVPSASCQFHPLSPSTSSEGLNSLCKPAKSTNKIFHKENVLESQFDQAFSKWRDYTQALEILPLCCTDALSLTHNFI